MSVKVGVRVRPYNQREKDLQCRLCIDMMGPTTRLFDADDPEKHRDFTFDYSFWSHDSFFTDQRGYFKGQTEKYSDQQYVFEQVGLEILANAWQGYHCCLFAYGQTGAGKSYSMVGYGANKGIVPISCEEIFKRISENEDKNKQYEVNVSMLEIYNEKVQDLLIPMTKRTKEGYKIREHKTLGIYVEGLSKHYVDTYESIQSKMNEGSSNRSIAATQMNASSSRAHTIISIEFRQKDLFQGKKREKLSVIHLVDLAGSEKVGKTGATGDRLKEAAGINKSLSVLGLVISTLADKALGKGKGSVVPYRDSCLTRILQNALGGNSKTLMICAISPATDNYEQTLSTLRYADQAKKIQNKAVVNESQTDKIIRNLTAEKDDLKEKLSKFEEMFKKISGGLNFDTQKLEQFNEAKEQLRFNTMMMNDYSMSKTEKLQQESEIQKNNLSSIRKIDMTKPHLSNLNEDPQLSRRINYSIDQMKTTIGRRNAEPENKIEIGGIGIRSYHACIEKTEESKLFIEPTLENEDSGCYLNGNPIVKKIELMHLDRLIFGTNNFFVIIIPEGDVRDSVQESEINWEYAQNELYLKKEEVEKKQIQEREKKMKQENQAILKQKQEELQQLQKRLIENEELRKNLEAQKEIEKAELEKQMREEEAEKLRLEIEKNKKQIKDSETLQKERIKEKHIFQRKLLKSLPKCIELNLIAKEFKRNISMAAKMLMYNDDDDDQIQMKKRSIKIKVTNKQQGYSYWWDTEKLSNRYYIIKDMAQTYFENGNIPELQKKDDPFWDPPEPSLIGKAFMTTKALAYMFDNKQTLPIIGENDQCGQLIVDMIPTNETGQKNLCEQLDEEQLEYEPEQLLGNPFYFNMVIESGVIPENFEKIFVQYIMKVTKTKKETFSTDQLEETTNPIFNYRKFHSFAKIDDILLDYLLNTKIIFKVYGVEKIPIEKKLPVQQEMKEKIQDEKKDKIQAELQEKVESPPKKKKKKGEGKTKKSEKKGEKKEGKKEEKKEEKEEKGKNISDQVRARNQAEKNTIPNEKEDKKKVNGQKKDDCTIF